MEVKTMPQPIKSPFEKKTSKEKETMINYDSPKDQFLAELFNMFDILEMKLLKLEETRKVLG